MFRIATKKINHNLEVKGKAPVFKLSNNDSSSNYEQTNKISKVWREIRKKQESFVSSNQRKANKLGNTYTF